MGKLIRSDIVFMIQDSDITNTGDSSAITAGILHGYGSENVGTFNLTSERWIPIPLTGIFKIVDADQEYTDDHRWVFTFYKLFAHPELQHNDSPGMADSYPLPVLTVAFHVGP